MGKADMNYIMIKSAVENGFKDVLENPARSIRKLVDLGLLFSGGDNQRNFFDIASRELENDKSLYYNLAERITRSMNHDKLLSFGMNFGYNALIKGAATIRSIEEKLNFNIPWCLLFDGISGQDITIKNIAAVLEQGIELGIFTYFFRLNKDFGSIDDLIELFEEKEDCAFVLLVHPSQINSGFVERCINVKNLCIFMQLDDMKPEITRNGAQLLSNSNLLRGGFINAENYSNANETMKYADILDLPLFIFMNENADKPDFSKEGRQQVNNMRLNLPYPVFPVDFYSDIEYIDKNISSTTCLSVIFDDGSIKAGGSQHFNIKETPLKNIFSSSMPRKKLRVYP
ncbi:hypothetical protein LJB89_00295 [Tyzzerella sp. OttesenSCG-928-J15]|nr:hypothetical protein [Tyzzerella sp. OttesenSCG-928-J15]